MVPCRPPMSLAEGRTKLIRCIDSASVAVVDTCSQIQIVRRWLEKDGFKEFVTVVDSLRCSHAPKVPDYCVLKCFVRELQNSVSCAEC